MAALRRAFPVENVGAYEERLASDRPFVEPVTATEIIQHQPITTDDDGDDAGDVLEFDLGDDE